MTSENWLCTLYCMYIYHPIQMYFALNIFGRVQFNQLQREFCSFDLCRNGWSSIQTTSIPAFLLVSCEKTGKEARTKHSLTWPREQWARVFHAQELLRQHDVIWQARLPSNCSGRCSIFREAWNQCGKDWVTARNDNKLPCLGRRASGRLETRTTRWGMPGVSLCL